MEHLACAAGNSGQRRRGAAGLRVSRRECLAGLLPTLLWPLRAASAPRAKPNILFIMIDTLRADHVGCYGYGKPTTPSIDRLAREGVRFPSLYTAGPWTMPSVMTMFTSLYPTVHGATGYQHRASLKVTTLAEHLKRLGYRRTVGIVSNPTVNSRYGFAQGFDRYDDYSIFFAHELNLFELDDVPQRKSVVEAVTSHTVTRMATDWLAKEGRRGPWFLFLLYFDPHTDYVPPQPWDRRFDPHPHAENRKAKPNVRHLLGKDTTPSDLEHILALYDGEIGYTDRCVGELLTRLDRLGLRDNTVVLLTSDHGEEFLDHGGILHGRTLYDELMRGILILRHPDRLPAGKVAPARACHLDIAPTLIECIGEKPDGECQGVSQLRAITGTESDGSSAPDRPCYLEATSTQDLRAVVVGRHKLVHDVQAGREELLDLESDPKERTNVASQKPHVCGRLRAMLTAHVSECEGLARKYQSHGTVVRPKLTRRDIQILRALGYIQ